MSDTSYQPKTYRTNGGDKMVVASGGEMDVESGGALKIAGTDKTAAIAAAVANPVASVAAGLKIVHGVKAVGAAQEDVATGLATVTACGCSLVGAPSMTHNQSVATVGNQTGQPAAGSIRINSYKPTAVNDVTPTAASSTFANVAWWAAGS